MDKKQLKLWFLIPLIVFLGLMVMLFFRLGKPTDIVPDTVLDRPVPMFELPLLSDTSRTITQEQLPKTPYLINVWGSWCPTCYVEHPFFLELESRGVDIVGVNYKDEIGDALGYLNDLGDPYLMSVQDKSGQFALDLGLTGAPETFVVDSDGVIRQHILGEIHATNWRERIEPCLSALQQASTDISEVCQ
ncbi:DsbE family thiol:disulfide interchange protein [Psychrobacter jeotgali]|uniref:DsbE family thiol:disulfide interchange protein n=1 Tax=Psychrobacter jeotgali TaxID=179010 RepID=UPI001918D229|nr:DsbE family thiol:disulfide interchange protein [Psychrobacter jeotgali]